MSNKFAVFILTHGRAKDQKTYNTLRRCGYTGKIFLVVDNTDKQMDEYKSIYGDNVLVFDKEEEYDKTDTFTNRKELKAVVYARNACFNLAKNLGYKWICVCDDDIQYLHYKIVQENKLKTKKIKSMNKVFKALVNYAKRAKYTCLSISEEGAYIGGVNQRVLKGLQPLCSHFMIMNTDEIWRYRSVLYEDVISSIEMKKAGKLCMATMLISMKLPTTGSNNGGMHDAYETGSDYLSAFHVVISNPDCAKIAYTKKFNQKVNWNAVYPKIISSIWKKETIS